eukprot:10630301-Karenia_brevis.AAC.1
MMMLTMMVMMMMMVMTIRMAIRMEMKKSALNFVVQKERVLFMRIAFSCIRWAIPHQEMHTLVIL